MASVNLLLDRLDAEIRAVLVRMLLAYFKEYPRFDSRAECCFDLDAHSVESIAIVFVVSKALVDSAFVLRPPILQKAH